METPKVKFGPQRLFRLRAQFADFEFADLVTQRLPRPADIAVHFGLDIGIGQRAVVTHEGDRLRLGPTFRMEPGIDNQSACPPHLIAEPTHILFRRVIDAHFDAQMLGVECPALHKRRKTRQITAEFGEFHFLLQRNLVMMPGHRFMAGQRRQFPQGSLVKLRRVDIISARNATRGRSLIIIGRCRSFGDLSRNFAHAIG